MQQDDDQTSPGCFLVAPPLPANEDRRLKFLHSYCTLDTSSEQSFDDLAGLAALICEVPIALISLVDRDRQWFKSHIGIDATDTPRSISFSAHAILTPGKIMEVSDAREDERFKNNPLVTGDPNIVFYAGAPLVVPTGEAIGTLCVADRKPRQLTDMQRLCLAGLATQAMTLLELRRSVLTLEAEMESQSRYVNHLEHAQQELEQESSTDSLTDLGNRRAFEERLAAELAKGSMMGGVVALMILDVDFFKRYNDSFGHPAGDLVLKQLAGLMRQACRSFDFPVRVGGEEFAVVLPGTTRESAFMVAERLRRSVQRAMWLHRPVTISIGVALARKDESMSSLLERADVALYHSKKDGRNRVKLAEEIGVDAKAG